MLFLYIFKALLYEGNRLFSDRLSSEDDKKQFRNIVKAVLESELGYGANSDETEGKFHIIYIDF